MTIPGDGAQSPAKVPETINSEQWSDLERRAAASSKKAAFGSKEWNRQQDIKEEQARKSRWS